MCQMNVFKIRLHLLYDKGRTHKHTNGVEKVNMLENRGLMRALYIQCI